MNTESLVLIAGVLLIAFVAVAGGIVALIRQKVVVDQAGHVTDIEIPLLGRFRSNYPSIAAVVIGTLLAFGTLHMTGIKPSKVPITAKVFVASSNGQMRPNVIVGAIPREYRVEQPQVAASHWKEIKVFVDKSKTYGVIVYTPVHIDPETGSTTLAAVYGTPDENNVFEARLELNK